MSRTFKQMTKEDFEKDLKISTTVYEQFTKNCEPIYWKDIQNNEFYIQVYRDNGDELVTLRFRRKKILGTLMATFREGGSDHWHPWSKVA